MFKLKNCPFCGGKAKLVSSPVIMVQIHYVICEACKARTDNCITKTSAIDKWNRRNNCE